MVTVNPHGAAAHRTVLEVVRLSTGYLEERRSESARLDSELLVAHALGLRRIDLYLQYDRPLGDGELDSVRELLRRRGRGEPVAYLTGVREFYGRGFLVNPSVLIPRPETETLVGRAIRAAGGVTAELRIADLGTGSGCIACTLAAELPRVTVIASDVSREALAVAAANADALGVADRVLFVEGEWADGIVPEVDMVVGNPPYVTAAELETLPLDVTHEPRLALAGGADGLDAYRAIFPAVADRCPTASWVGVEIDSRRAGAVGDLARATWPYAEIAVTPDLSGRPRVLEVQPA
jgi:release factor glutamine methyltransferase